MSHVYCITNSTNKKYSERNIQRHHKMPWTRIEKNKWQKDHSQSKKLHRHQRLKSC